MVLLDKNIVIIYVSKFCLDVRNSKPFENKMSNHEIEKVINNCEKMYDHDEFQEGVRVTKKAMQKFPNSAEIIAWHAFFLEKTKEHQEALNQIKVAIMKDMGNKNVWKLQGAIYKEQNEYLKALQSFTMAYKKIQPGQNDVGILGELCSITLFLQQYKLNLEYTRQLVNITSRQDNVLRYAYAHYVNGDKESSLNYVKILEEHYLPSRTEEDRLFRAEVGRFHSLLLLELKKYKECIEYLDNEIYITDRITVLEHKAQCYQNLNNKENLMKTLNLLLKEYPDNGDYFAILEGFIPLDEYMTELFRIKSEYKSNYAAVRILELMDINNEQFKPLLKEHLEPLLKKGSPAIYATIADFTQDKLDVAMEIAKTIEVSISSVPIVHILFAQIYNSRKEYEKAIAEVDEGLKQNPTVVELYVTKIYSLQKSGRSKEALETAKILSELDPADKNSNNAYVRMLFRNGQIKSARLAAEPFSINAKKHPRLYKTEFNKIHFRAGRASLRGGKIDDALHFFQDILGHFDAYRNGMFAYLAWGSRRIMAIHEIFQWSLTLPNERQNAKAFASVARIFLMKGMIKELRNECNKFVTTKNEEALAYMAVAYALSGDVLLAVKCFSKLSRKFALIAHLAVDKAVKTVEVPEIVKEVINEVYKPFNEDAQGPEELLNKARGLLYTGNKEEAEKVILEAAKCEMNFRIAVDLHLFAKVEALNEGLADKVVETIHQKYPKYEIKFDNFEEDEPHAFVIRNEK